MASTIRFWPLCTRWTAPARAWIRHAPAPVSYTHLDVYKRQLLLRLIFVGLNMASVPQDLIYLVKGGIILFACALDMRKYLVKK